MNSYSRLGSDIDRFSETAEQRNVENNRDNKVAYTNDFDGAYHVEQDDETEDDNLINRERH
ncbi:MAG: hypothetical protein JWR72_312 [Flavisolibacter sp.]|jgi:hypothetical protein|nr:hypothetical protein [Flavisolibacter sp.]